MLLCGRFTSQSNCPSGDAGRVHDDLATFERRQEVQGGGVIASFVFFAVGLYTVEIQSALALSKTYDTHHNIMHTVLCCTHSLPVLCGVRRDLVWGSVLHHSPCSAA